MFHKPHTRIIAATIAIAMVVAMIFTIHHCTRPEDKPLETQTQASPQEEAERILAAPAQFDQRSLAEYAEAIAGNEEFDEQDLALMIVSAEAAANRIGQILEQLDANLDAADSYNTITEASQQSWPQHLRTIANFLTSSAPLDAQTAQRAEQLKNTLVRYQCIINNIERTQLKGKATALTLTPDNNHSPQTAQ